MYCGEGSGGVLEVKEALRIFLVVFAKPLKWLY